MRGIWFNGDVVRPCPVCEMFTLEQAQETFAKELHRSGWTIEAYRAHLLDRAKLTKNECVIFSTLIKNKSGETGKPFADVIRSTYYSHRELFHEVMESIGDFAASDPEMRELQRFMATR